MTFAEKAKFFEANKVRSSDVITCEVITNNYSIGAKDDFSSWTLSGETFEIVTKYIRDWLNEAVVEYDLAGIVLDGIILGLRKNVFTIQDVAHDESNVRDFINDLI